MVCSPLSYSLNPYILRILLSTHRNCAYNFMSNIMYAVLYSYTPEIFPTKDRGTGNAITASANRVFGIMAPIVAMFANLETSAPVYVSGALFIASGLLVLALPFESRGKASL